MKNSKVQQQQKEKNILEKLFDGLLTMILTSFFVGVLMALLFAVGVGCLLALH